MTQLSLNVRISFLPYDLIDLIHRFKDDKKILYSKIIDDMCYHNIKKFEKFFRPRRQVKTFRSPNGLSDEERASYAREHMNALGRWLKYEKKEILRNIPSDEFIKDKGFSWKLAKYSNGHY